MTITVLDTQSALIVIDLQAGTLGDPTAPPSHAQTGSTAEIIALLG